MKSPNNGSIEHEISGRKMTYPSSTIHSLFTKQAEIFPNSIALECADKQVTYAKLDILANQMAHFFWTQGLRPGQIVAISLNRTPELIACLFAVLKCGAAYLPLDPKFPIARLEFMIKDSEASFLLTSKSLLSSLPIYSKTTVIEDILSSLDKQTDLAFSIPVSHEVPAYILYTSGSTGKPKGVIVNHKNLVNFLYGMKIQPGINENDKLLSITTISFDIAGLELFLPLIFGATVVFAENDITCDGQLLLKVLEEKEITILQATPTIWQMLLDSGWKNPLQLKALCGGEAMPLNLARELLSRCDSLWNMYGPTETTIWSTIKKIKSDDELITIGLPIANTQIYLLNEQRQAVEPGSIGEIVIGGDGVTLGYWKRPELTSEKFILNPFSVEPNSIIYRTGDLGKLLPNGELQCLGRIDNQVKIRGHRIELGEIEAALNSLPGVKQSVVIMTNYFGNNDKIIAYLKSSELTLDDKQIRNTLLKVLPQSFLPSKYIWVNEFPTTPNGKIDKKSLDVPKYLDPDSVPLLRKPRIAIGAKIAEFYIEPSNTIEIEVIQKSLITGLPLVSDDSLFSSSTDSTIAKTKESNKDSILIQISEIIKNVSGLIYEYDTVSNTFLELGLDSLSLIQLASKLKKEFDLPITLRQLNEVFSSPKLLADYILINLPKKDSTILSKEEEMISNNNNNTKSFSLKNSIALVSNQNQITLDLIDQQIHLLSQKKDLLQQQNNSVDETFSSKGSKIESHFPIDSNNEIVVNDVSKSEKIQKIISNESPIPGAKLGRDEDGNPAWFIENSAKNGEYIKIN